MEPAIFTNKDGSTGLGISVLRHANRTFDSGKGGFVPHQGIAKTTLRSHFPSIAIAPDDTIFLTWDTQPRKPKSSGGCNGDETPKANSIKLAYTKDFGKTWSKPMTVAHPGTTVLWPWMTIGDAGKVSVVWYQYDRVTDPDCGKGKVYVYDANIFGADGHHPKVKTVNAWGRPIHKGGICQGGTTCVATGQDRRLGDYFTNALDPNGCVIIATGDTMLTDPATGSQLPLARPLFIKQDSGRSLTGGDCGPSRR